MELFPPDEIIPSQATEGDISQKRIGIVQSGGKDIFDICNLRITFGCIYSLESVLSFSLEFGSSAEIVL